MEEKNPDKYAFFSSVFVVVVVVVVIIIFLNVSFCSNIIYCARKVP